MRPSTLIHVNPGNPGQLIDDAHGVHADGADALQQVDDPFLVVGEACIAADYESRNWSIAVVYIPIKSDNLNCMPDSHLACQSSIRSGSDINQAKDLQASSLTDLRKAASLRSRKAVTKAT